MKTKKSAEEKARNKVVELARSYVCEHQGVNDCNHFKALDRAVIALAKLEAKS